MLLSPRYSIHFALNIKHIAHLKWYYMLLRFKRATSAADAMSMLTFLNLYS